MVFRTEFAGLFCLVLVYVSVGYADYVVINWILMEHFLESIWFGVHLILFNILLVIMLVCHTRAVFSDPGIISKPKVAVDFSDPITREQFARPGWTICTKCDMYRPPRAHHCGTCKRCIRKMDHHCPWVNNCVGEWNQKFFILFLFYTNMTTLYAVVLLIAAWVLIATTAPPLDQDRRESLTIHSVILAVECVLYFTFTIAIGCDQISAIMSQKSQIDKLKEVRSRSARTSASVNGGSRASSDVESGMVDDDDRTVIRRLTTRERFEDVFGDDSLWKWFLPVPSSRARRSNDIDESSEFLL